MASFGNHRLVPDSDCRTLDKVRHQNDKAKGIVKQSSEAKSTSNIGKLTAFRRPSNPSTAGHDLVQKRTRDILNSTRLIHAAKKPSVDQLPEERTTSLVSRDRRRSDVTFVQKKKNLDLAGKRASVGEFTRSDLIPNSCEAFAGVSGKLTRTVNKKKFTKTSAVEECIEPDDSKVCDRTFVKEFDAHEQNLRLDSLSKRQTSNPNYYKTYYGDALCPTSSSCFGVDLRDLHSPDDLQSSSNVFLSDFPQKGSVTSISPAEKDFMNDVADLFTSTPRASNKDCLTIPAFQKARILENEGINRRTKDVLVSEMNPAASSFPGVEMAEGSFSEAQREVVLGLDGNRKGIFERSQNTDKSRQLERVQLDANSTHSLGPLTSAAVDVHDDDFFNELEFEVFENEDLGMKPKRKDVKPSEDLSIIDLDSLKPSDLTLLPAFDSTHLAHVGSSQKKLEPQSRSGALGLKRQKSYSSPENFTDLSLALLPDFDVGSMLWEEDAAAAAAAAFRRNSCGEFPLQWSSMSRSDATSDLCSVSPKMNSALKKPSGAAISSVRSEIKKDKDNLDLGLKCLEAIDNGCDDESRVKSVSPAGVRDLLLNLSSGNHIASNAVTFQSLEPTDAVDANENKLEMTSEVFHGSQKQASLDATSSEIPRPASSARRQLPVPLSPSCSSPTKTFPSPKLSDKAPNNNGGVNVQVELERQVKVEVVKQVNVDCTVREGCESPSSGTAPCPNVPSAGSFPAAVSSVLGRKSPKHLSRPSKVDVTAAKLVLAQSISASIAPSPRKEKPETDRSGLTSSPSVGVQRTTRKGIARQLPSADLTKRPGNSQTLHRPTVFHSKLPVDGKSLENGRPASKVFSTTSKPSLGFVSSRITKATVSMDSSRGTNALVKRPLRYSQPPANLIPRLERRSLVRGSARKTNAESDSLSVEAKSKIHVESHRPEKPSGSTVKNSRKLNAVDQGLKISENSRSILPKKRQGLSVVDRDSRSSSRRTSNSSISCTSRSEAIPRGSLLVESSRPNEPQETAASNDGDDEEMVNKQYVHQPDILSNSVLPETPTKKVHQLETKCRELGQMLKVSASELKSRTDAFLATSVAVGHFSGKVEILSETISDLKSQIALNNSRYDVLLRQHDALVSEIQCLKEDHEVEVNGMTVTHQMELHAAHEKMKALVLDVKEKHLQLMNSAQSESKQAIEELKSLHAGELEAKSVEFRQQMADIETKHRQKIVDLQRSQEGRIKELKTQFEAVKCALVEKVDHLNTECNDLRYQNQILAERNPPSVSNLGNSEGERQVETLTQEIHSLKVVLDLRNQEIGKLKAQNVVHGTQLQELTEAQQKIHKLQVKLENTEAIIHMKSDYEKELSEKHTTLLRKYNKESKVNKRLSMNNEELTWRLEQVVQAQTTSPKPIRRTLSGPATKSASGTPLVVRRSQPEVSWESFSTETDGVSPGGEDSDRDSVVFQ